MVTSGAPGWWAMRHAASAWLCMKLGVPGPGTSPSYRIPPKTLPLRVSYRNYRPNKPPVLSFSFPTQQLRPGPPRTRRSQCGAACPSSSSPISLSSIFLPWEKEAPSLGDQTRPMLKDRREESSSKTLAFRAREDGGCSLFIYLYEIDSKV